MLRHVIRNSWPYWLMCGLSVVAFGACRFRHPELVETALAVIGLVTLLLTMEVAKGYEAGPSHPMPPEPDDEEDCPVVCPECEVMDDRHQFQRFDPFTVPSDVEYVCPECGHRWAEPPATRRAM